MMRKLINSIQNYAWGSTNALTRLYGIANPSQQPMAELWIGAHPKGSSQIVINGQLYSLRELIDKDKVGMLGIEVTQRFGGLPFLFKVICAEKPLSMQVHPSKSAAMTGFARENAAGIPLSDSKRNYKDANHKPELLYAITPFKAINSFRPLREIVLLLQPVASAHPAIARFLNGPDQSRLADIFSSLFSMKDKEKARAMDILNANIASQQDEPWQTIADIAKFYPDDCGLFAPLLLNVITLQPGEAMFLFTQTPHAYLHGVALEVMANSDNVLRAGLTLKYIDVPELLVNVQLTSRPADSLLITPQQDGNSITFPVPSIDFNFSIYFLSDYPLRLEQQSASIVFCIDGSTQLRSSEQELSLNAGESVFIPASLPRLSLTGSGRLARVYNKIS